MGEGTALGVRRNGTFIPHDDDIDVATRIRYLDTFVRDALPLLEQQGFRVAKVWNGGRFITLLRRREALDVDFVEQGHQCMFLTTGKILGNINQCDNLEQFLRGLTPVNFLGRQFWIPGDDYFRHMYGDDWQTPRGGNARCSKKQKV